MFGRSERFQYLEGLVEMGERQGRVLGSLERGPGFGQGLTEPLRVSRLSEQLRCLEGWTEIGPVAMRASRGAPEPQPCQRP